MSLSDPRVQLLANLKCLYGANVEVLTLCVDTPCDKYQAVAMSFDPFTATWTKFLHSEPTCKSSRDVIENLLRKSERELAKLFSASGNTVPFQGITVQTVTIRREQRRDSSARNSTGSEVVFVATLGSTLSDTVPDESVRDEHVGEVTAFKELLVDEAHTEGPVVEEEEPISVSKALEPLCGEPDPVSQEFETTSSDLNPQLICKKDKKGKRARFTLNETCLAEEDPTEAPIEKPPPEARVEESWVEEEVLANEVRSTCNIVEEIPACHPEPPFEDGFAWGSFSVAKQALKKDKKAKKKGKLCVEEFEPALEPSIEPEPEPEPIAELVEDSGWGSFSASKKGKKGKKKGKVCVEEFEPALEPSIEPEPTPEPTEDFSWGSFSTLKKKGNTLTVEEQNSPPELEPVSDPVDEFEETKLDEPKSAPSPPRSSLPSESQPRTEDDVWESLKPQAPHPPESVRHSTPALFTAATSTESKASTILGQAAQGRRPVVLTIQFPNEISSKPLKVMATIADNTRTAIIDTVNLHLDSKSMPNGMKGQRKIQITYGVGRNGSVDLSTLEESMWPEYLDYFRQYTRIPELTVDVADC